MTRVDGFTLPRGVAVPLRDGARLNFGFRILKNEKILILEGGTCHVCTGLNEKPKRIPEELALKLSKWLEQLNELNK